MTASAVGDGQPDCQPPTHHSWADGTGKVVIRWMDGYLEEFGDLDEARFSASFVTLCKGDLNRWVPLGGVRWFSVYPESHEP